MLFKERVAYLRYRENIRDWLHVEDHCEAIYEVLTRGRVGETYNIGGRSERNNITIVHKICETLDRVNPRQDKVSYKEQITFVKEEKSKGEEGTPATVAVEEIIQWMGRRGKSREGGGTAGGLRGGGGGRLGGGEGGGRDGGGGGEGAGGGGGATNGEEKQGQDQRV